MAGFAVVLVLLVAGVSLVSTQSTIGVLTESNTCSDVNNFQMVSLQLGLVVRHQQKMMSRIQRVEQHDTDQEHLIKNG